MRFLSNPLQHIGSFSPSLFILINFAILNKSTHFELRIWFNLSEATLLFFSRCHLMSVISTTQEKRKIPPVPNGVTDLGESEAHGGHGGPELQRTGR